MTQEKGVDILIPACARPAALAACLASLTAQDFKDFSVVISDQTEEYDVASMPELRTLIRILASHGNGVTVYKRLPMRGMAEQRHFLLERSSAPSVLFIDDDLVLEPYVVGRMRAALDEEKCGFVGSATIGLSYLNDIRPFEQHIEFWEGRVEPETVLPETQQWERHRLHNAANIYHVQKALGISPANQRKYRVAWVGGCVMYDADKLRRAGGFSFWRRLPPEHCGEDVLAQLNVMEIFGGCGIIPTGVYHQELPTTIPDRRVNVVNLLKNGNSALRNFKYST